jgi:hypothetical protein
VAGSPAAAAAMAAHRDLITGETLATSLDLLDAGALDGDPAAGDPVSVGDGEAVRIRVTS